jgi:hypothetical protein
VRISIPLSLAFAALVQIQPAAAQDPASSIVGVWKLTGFERREIGTDKTVRPFGDHPAGYRIHTRGGHAFYMFFGTDRKAPAGSVTDADRIDLFKTMTAAGGSYKVDGDKVVFLADVSSAQSMNGGSLTYRFSIAGRTLTMTTDPLKNPAGGPQNVLVSTYERVE